MQYILLIGRIFFSLTFILASVGHWSRENFEWAANQGLPMAPVVITIGWILAFLGGLSILLGYKAKVGAWLLVILMVPVTLLMTQFTIPNGEIAGMVKVWMFLKNLSMLGAALMFTYFGSGPLSLDKCEHKKSKKR